MRGKLLPDTAPFGEPSEYHRKSNAANAPLDTLRPCRLHVAVPREAPQGRSVVDLSLKKWNLFFKMVRDWAPVLRMVYDTMERARIHPVVESAPVRIFASKEKAK